MTTRPDRPATHPSAPGPALPSTWPLDLDAGDLEVYTTTDRALVLVDRTPISNADGTAHVRRGIHGLGPAELSLVGEVRSVTDAVVHGVYSGLLGGVAILMDQYVRMLNGAVTTVIYVIAHASGPAHADRTGDATIIALMEAGTGPGISGIERIR